MAQSHATTTAHHDADGTDKPGARDRVRDAAASTRDQVDTVARSVRDTANQVSETTVDAAQTFQSEFDGAVRRNPTLAVLGAVGVGVLLGMALNKRD